MYIQNAKTEKLIRCFCNGLAFELHLSKIFRTRHEVGFKDSFQSLY